MRAVITGASSGIGRDIARVLSARGVELILVARREDRLRELAAALPTRTAYIAADLSKAENCRALYDRLRGTRIDILVNNAGLGVFGAFDETPLEHELQMLDVNVRAAHILMKLFLRDFVRRDSGYILNVASFAGFSAGPLFSSYYASKAYLLRLSQSVSEELRRRGSRVSVSVLCPGPVKTEFDRVAGVTFALPGRPSGWIAEKAVEGLFRRKPVIVPGAEMKLLRVGQRLLPEAAVTRLAYRAQKRKQR